MAHKRPPLPIVQLKQAVNQTATQSATVRPKRYAGMTRSDVCTTPFGTNHGEVRATVRVVVYAHGTGMVAPRRACD